MIEIQNLYKHFGDLTAVDDISFNVAPGEVLGFLGPNGAGKSTTMKIITGFLRPGSGRVSVFGHDLATEALEAQRQIGYLPEGAPCYEEMSPLGFLEFIAEVRGLKGADKERRMAVVIDQMSLQPVLHQRIETLSKGFKRRVGLAQAVLHDPKVLILDEPTDGLDPNQKHQVREMIRGLSADKIVVISTHILEEVTAVCTRAVIIAQGKILADCTPMELESQSRYHQAVTFKLSDDSEAAPVASLLEALDYVKEVQTDNQLITVFPHSNERPVLMNLHELIREHSWNVEALYQERGHLDEVFRDITQGGMA